MTRGRITTAVVAALAVLAAAMTTGPAGADIPQAAGSSEGAVLFFPQVPGGTVSFWNGQRTEHEACCWESDGSVGQALVGNFDSDGLDEMYGYSIGTSSQLHVRPFFEDTTDGPVFDLARSPSHLTGLYIPLVGDFGGPTGPDGRSIDDILWYAPGSVRDTLWIHKPDGAASKYHLRIDGSYRPVVVEGDGYEPEAIIWYAPGGGSDSIWDFRDVPAGGHRTYPLNVSGSYQPTSFATDDARLVHWYSADGHDSTWRFDDSLGGAGRFRFRNLTTPQTDGARRPIPLDRGETAGVFLYAPGAAQDVYVGTTDATGGALQADPLQVWGQYRHVVAGDVTSATPGTSDGVDELIFGGGDRAVMWRMPTIGTRVETTYTGLAERTLPVVVATELPTG